MAQPLLDLFGRNPEFFVAGNYSSGQIIWFALLIVVVPPVVGIGLTALATLIDRRLGSIVFGAVVAVLATAFGLALLRTLGLDQLLAVLVLVGLVGAGVTVLVLRRRGVQLFVSYLAVANLFFLGSFLFFSPASELVAGAAPATSATSWCLRWPGRSSWSCSTSSRRRRSCGPTARSTPSATRASPSWLR